MGSVWSDSGKLFGDCFASLHVWHNSHSGLFFQTWNAPRLAGGFYDEPRVSHDTAPNLLIRFLKNLGRNVRATAVYFLAGVLLSALFQRYVPADSFAELFGKSNEEFGVLMAATIGVPLYACGGTIPLLQQRLVSGMSMGSAAAFMITNLFI